MSYVTKLVDSVREAQKKFEEFSQEQVDAIFKAAALAANHARIPLAKHAVEETQRGIVEDKVIKNHFAAEYIYNTYKNTQTCGIVEEDTAYGIRKVALPFGVIAAVVPTTNPTSTAIFKTLIALKTRNGIIVSPHPSANACTIAAAKIVYDAAVKAGAPAGIIQWIDKEHSSLETTQELMSSVDLILATGGPGMVKAAYSSGVPALGVGAGNTPVIIAKNADIKMAVNSVLLSKTFDNGMICASEQSVIIAEEIYDEVRAYFIEMGAHVLSKGDADKMRKTILIEKKPGQCSLNADIVGRSAYQIAEMGGVKVHEDAKVLIGEVDEVEFDKEPFAHEKLSPVLAMYKYKRFEDGVAKAERLIEQGGLGHTSVLYIDEHKSPEKAHLFLKKMKTCRTLINMPAAQGAIGDVFNFKLAPSLTLGCGSWGNNSVSENIGVKHLLNTKTIAERRENMLWFRVPEKIYFKWGSLPLALKELEGKKKRAFIVTDEGLASMGYPKFITKTLDECKIDYHIYSGVQADPTLDIVEEGTKAMNAFKPDVIIALGGGSAMDAAKIMWVMHEHPEVNFLDLAMTFMDIRKRIAEFPEMGSKASLMCVATSSGTGSEVTPFAVITDQETGTKYPLADYALTPNVAVVDPELVMSMPAGLASASGIDVLTHALESLASGLASDYTIPLSYEATRLVFDYLPESVKLGKEARRAKEKMANASCIAGMAFSNAFLGICHSMAHKLGAAFHIPHGVANALMINEVVKFNAEVAPRKMIAFSQYKYPKAALYYARAADYLGLGGKDVDEKIALLLKKVDALKVEIKIPATIKEAGVSEADFLAKLDHMVEEAFDDQCTGANPRYPLFKEIKEMYLRAFYGEAEYEKKHGAKSAKKK